MRKIESITDEMKGVVTYKLDDGRYINFNLRDIEHYGLSSLLQRDGVEKDKRILPVIQDGHMVGTLPADFNPHHIQSRTDLFYRPRPGDFRLDGDRWIADPGLGHGDLQAVIGFQEA